MSKKLRAFLALIMTAAMLLGVMPITVFATAEPVEDAVCRIGETYYTSIYSAFGALQDGDTLYLLKEWDGSGTNSIPDSGSYTIESAPELEEKVTIKPRNLSISFNGKDVTLTLKNVNVDSTGSSGTIRVGTATLIIDEGTKIENGNPAITSNYSRAGTVIMKPGALMTNNKRAVVISSGLIFRMEGGSITGNDRPSGTTSGIALNQGTLIISGDAQVTENTVGDIPANIYVASGNKIDLTGISGNAKIGITIDDEIIPTGDAPYMLATISGTDIPSGLTIDQTDYAYELKAGTKLDAGALYLVDPNSTSTTGLRGNGTVDDPFRVKSFDEWKAVIAKVNNRAMMNYVMVDGAFDTTSSKVYLSGRMTLYANDPEEDIITNTTGATLYLSGSDVELVVKDIEIQSDPDKRYTSFVDTYGSETANGSITIEDGTVFTGFTDGILAADSCDVNVNGGTFKNSTGGAINTKGAVEISGGTFTNLGYVAYISGDAPAVRLDGSYVFSGNSQDFTVDYSNPAPILTAPLNSDIIIQTSYSHKLPVLTAEDASYLEGWEDKVSEKSDIELELSDDGKSIVVKGAEREAISILRWGDGGVQGKYLNAGTETVRMGSWYTNGITQMQYNGYDMKAVFTQAKLVKSDNTTPIANLIDSAGNEITDANGNIIKWDSPDLEYYVQWSNTATKESGKIYGENGVIDNIPGTPGNGGWTHVRYKGNDQYLPYGTGDQFSIYGYEMITGESLYSASPQLKSGITLRVVNDTVVYTGEEVKPEIEITIENSNLMGGQKVTLTEDDYFLGVNESDWNVGENRTAWLYFQGCYSPSVGQYRGYAISFKVTPGTFEVDDYEVVVSQDDISTQTVDLTKLTVTPEQASYVYVLGEIPTNNSIENVAIDGSSLTFDIKDSGEAGEVIIPVTLTSDNGTGEADIIVTVTAKTSGAVALRSEDKTYYFDTLSEAMVYAQDGDSITLSEVITEEELVIDKAITIDGGKTGGIVGNVVLAAKVTISECDLSEATISLDDGGLKSVLTHNYWSNVSPKAENSEREQLYPFYKNEEMTVIVNDPALAVDHAMKSADALIFNKSDDLISLRDIRNKMGNKEVQAFLREHKEDFDAILDELYTTTDPEALSAYLEENDEAKELFDLLQLAYDVACKIVPVPSVPDVDSASVTAASEEGAAAADEAKNSLENNSAVGEYIPVFANGIKLDDLDGVTDTTLAIYLKIAILVEEIRVDESTDTPVISSITFDVTPEYSVESAGSGLQELPNESLNGSVSFRLPVPESVTFAIAKVEHEGEDTKYLPIKTSAEGDKYIDMTVRHFSRFTVSFIRGLVTFDPNGGRCAIENAEIGIDGSLNELPNARRTAHPFKGWFTAPKGGTRVTEDTIFSENTTVYAQWSRVYFPIDELDTYYRLSFDTNGGEEIDSVRGLKGDEILLADYIPEREGYEFNGWYSDEKLADKIEEVRLNKNTTIYAGWTEIKAEDKPDTPKLPYTDVTESDPNYDSIVYVTDNNIMNGTGDGTKFSSDITITRGMIVTMLYRLEGSPNVIPTTVYTDVPAWCNDAIAWGTQMGIIKGYGNGLCGADDNINNEQLAVMLLRYAAMKGYDVSDSEGDSILYSTDAASISDWAMPAVKWAYTKEIITADSMGNILPKLAPSRGMVAGYLHRFMINVK